jgi:hypothetical protein
MQSKLQILSLSQIVEDTELYPRNHENWFLTNKYAKAMRTGAVFPPICVALFAVKYCLVDGLHRKRAYKVNKIAEIQVEVLPLKTREAIFAEAVKRNVQHGASLSTQETVNAIVKLRAMKFDNEAISHLVNIPIKSLKSFVALRLVNNITGEEIGIKAPLMNLAGTTVSDEILAGQNVYSARSQEHIVDQMLRLLETGSFNKKNQPLMEKLKVIRKLIERLVLSKRK